MNELLDCELGRYWFGLVGTSADRKNVLSDLVVWGFRFWLGCLETWGCPFAVGLWGDCLFLVVLT